MTSPLDGQRTQVRQVLVEGNCEGTDVQRVIATVGSTSVVLREGEGAFSARVLVPLGPSDVVVRCEASDGETATEQTRAVRLSSPAALGLSHSLLLTDSLVAFGANDSGQLGAGDLEAHEGGVEPALSDVAWLSASASSSAAVLLDGSLWIWGALVASPKPEQITLDGPAVAVSLGGGHGLVLMADGTVRAFGVGSSGQLGNGSTSGASTPVKVSELTDIVKVAAGSTHSAALRADGLIFVWGSNSAGVLGNGQSDSSSHPSPLQVPLVSDAVDIAAGREHMLAALADGTALAWGTGTSGQLGFGQSGSLANRPQPIVVAGLSNISSVMAAGNTSFAILSDGSSVGWGQNSSGQLGVGNQNQRDKPTTMLLPSSVAFIAPSATHGVALLTDGSAYGWGQRSSGQLGTTFPAGTGGAVSTPILMSW